ncbi:leucine-rich repeat domain-containing protein [Microcoleus sp. D3_18a_C4]
MSEQQVKQPINLSSFADWCKHKDSLSKEARHTVNMLLQKAGTSDGNEAEKILSNFTELDFNHDRTIDINPLSGLINLIKLSLSGNQITDITPLSGLTNLRELYLRDNQITDITPLSGLTNLTKLNLGYNQITDITPLSRLTNLMELNLNDNQITDITPLSGLTNLTELDFSGNQITDITPLSALINLTKLNLSNNQITEITPLSALINLTNLSLARNQITDITPLSRLINLTGILLIHNQITDITPLSALTNLTYLHLWDNQITDITPLSGLTNLTRLIIQNNPITDLNLPIELTQNYLTLSTKPIDDQKATEAVREIYAAIGKEAPKVIVCSSPQAAFLELFKLLEIDGRSRDQISEIAVTNLVWGKFLSHNCFQWANVEFSGSMLWKALSDAIILERNADYTLVSEFQELLKNDLESLGDDFRSYFEDLELLSLTNLLEEIHLTKFFISKFGITLDEKAQELLRCKQQLFEECGLILPFDKICIICDRPLHLRFDSENRLHAEGESAIAFADGYSLYFHHGVKLPEEYGKVHPDLWQAEWLLSEENAELRRVLIERIGYDRIIQELAVTELDSWQEYTLLSIEFDEDFDDEGNPQPVYLLKMTCPSTGFIHALRVPPDVRSSSRASLTAKEAIRWVNWDIDPEEFSVQT